VVEAAVRRRLIQPDGPLNGSELAGITDLLIPAAAGEVTDLGGVQCLVNLRVLAVPPGSLESLSPLAALGELTGVSFSDNQVISLAPLNDKPNLRAINAGENAITNLSDLSLVAQECGTLVLTENPLTEASLREIERFCAGGWFVTWGQVGTPSSCNDECLPRP
jgi:Leucine-rich repeat (LRR) protein